MQCNDRAPWPDKKHFIWFQRLFWPDNVGSARIAPLPIWPLLSATVPGRSWRLSPEIRKIFKIQIPRDSNIPHPPSPVPLLANFLRRNNFSVYCLQSCIMFRSWRRQIFCLIFRSMASAGNFLQGISNSPWKSNLCGNDFVQNSISQRIF